MNLAGGVTEPIHVIDQMIERLAVAGENEESAAISDQKGPTRINVSFHP